MKCVCGSCLHKEYSLTGQLSEADRVLARKWMVRKRRGREEVLGVSGEHLWP